MPVRSRRSPWRPLAGPEHQVGLVPADPISGLGHLRSKYQVSEDKPWFKCTTEKSA